MNSSRGRERRSLNFNGLVFRVAHAIHVALDAFLFARVQTGVPCQIIVGKLESPFSSE